MESACTLRFGFNELIKSISYTKQRDAGYVGYTLVHLHNRVKGHKQQSSAIAKHYKNVHGTMPQRQLERFKVLKKCKNKLDFFFTIFAQSFVNSLRHNRFKCCNLQDLFNIFLDNGVMNSPKRRILSLVFTVLCFKKSHLLLRLFFRLYLVRAQFYFVRVHHLLI